MFTIFEVGRAKQMETKQKTRETDANMAEVLIKFHSHTNMIHVSLQKSHKSSLTYMRFQIIIVNFTNVRFHVQNVSLDITSITLVWTGEAAEEPCKELMALSPLPPLGSQGSRVSPGEPPRPPL